MRVTAPRRTPGWMPALMALLLAGCAAPEVPPEEIPTGEALTATSDAVAPATSDVASSVVTVTTSAAAQAPPPSTYFPPPATTAAQAFPQADFWFDPVDPAPGDNVSFHSNSKEGDTRLVKWEWDFGNNSTLQGQDVLQTMPNATTAGQGINVTLTVTDAAQRTSSFTRFVPVVAKPPVDVDFTWDTPVYGGNFFRVYPTWNDPDGTVVAVHFKLTQPLWTPKSWWNDTQSQVVFLAGPKTGPEGAAVTMTVTDDDGGQANVTRNIVTLTYRPEAKFFYDPPPPWKVDQTITFEDLSTDADGVVVRWEWDFGDGTKSKEQNPRHAYSAPPSQQFCPNASPSAPPKYHLSLKVWDNDGVQNTYSNDHCVEVVGRE